MSAFLRGRGFVAGYAVMLSGVILLLALMLPGIIGIVIALT